MRSIPRVNINFLRLEHLQALAALAGVAALLLLLPTSSAAQFARNEGLPLFIEHYSHEDYSSHPQNWGVTQDHDGVIYVANRHGILEYDGLEWLLWPSTNHTTARSLAVAEDGYVYGGFVGDFGFLETQRDGSKKFVSLVDSLDAGDRTFDDVWGTHAVNGFVYFQTRDHVYRWDGRHFVLFPSQSTFRTSFAVNGRFYVRDRKLGLLFDDGESLQPAPGGDFFIDRQVYMMAPFVDGKILIGTREDGLFLYDHESVTRFETEADAWLLENRLYAGATIQHRAIVLGTLGGGIAVLTSEGRLHQIFNEEYGLVDGWINFVFVDRDDGIWLAHHNQGVARLDVPSELTLFDERHNLRTGLVFYLMRADDQLVVSTTSGLSQLDLDRTARYPFPAFEHLAAAGSSTHAALKLGSSLAVATDQGVDIIDTHGRLLTAVALGRTASLAATHDKDAFIAATATGIKRISLDGDHTTVTSLGHDDDQIDWVTYDSRGHVWAITRSREVLHLVPDTAGNADLFKAHRLGVAEGVPAEAFILSSFKEETVIVTQDGVHRYVGDEPSQARFVPDDRFDFQNTPGGIVRSFVQDQQGRVWVVRERRVDILQETADGRFHIDSPPVLRIPEWNIVQIYVEESGIAWLSNNHRLYRYDPSIGIRKTYEATLPPLIRQVTLVETGERISAEMFASASMTGYQELDYRQNAVRFDFALPSYNAPKKNQYQYFLEGHDRGWSDWTTSTHKNYTNLFEGTYRLRVRGMNAHGAVSPEAIYTFRILPPWYRTIWAYGLYLFILVVLGVFAFHYRRLSLAHRKAAEQAAELERERSVNERLQESYRRLQDANESLLQADKLKDEFLASTSHELRTPLTAILGFASILKEEVSGEHKEFLGMIEENGKRLLHTLNSLLDLAKLRVGMMDIHMQPTDVTQRAHEVGRLLMPLASKKGLYLDVRTPSTALYALLDPHCAERVLYNLIGNAIKFTASGGVTVVVSEEEDEIRITVTDTGIGIEEEFIPHLFDEFKQESSGNTREHEGTGLGLAITNRLVQIMAGSISVSSRKGEGSVFSVVFPRYHSVTERELEETPIASHEVTS